MFPVSKQKPPPSKRSRQCSRVRELQLANNLVEENESRKREKVPQKNGSFRFKWVERGGDFDSFPKKFKVL